MSEGNNIDEEKEKKDCIKISLIQNIILAVFFLFAFFMRINTNNTNSIYSYQLGVASFLYALSSIYIEFFSKKINLKEDELKNPVKKIGKDFNYLIRTESWLSSIMLFNYLFFSMILIAISDFASNLYSFIINNLFEIILFIKYFQNLSFLIMSSLLFCIIFMFSAIVFLIVNTVLMFIKSKYENKNEVLMDFLFSVALPIIIACAIYTSNINCTIIDFIGIISCFIPPILKSIHEINNPNKKS